MENSCTCRSRDPDFEGGSCFSDGVNHLGKDLVKNLGFEANLSNVKN